MAGEYPRGLGVYIRNIRRDLHGTPEEAAALAASHGVSFVAILGGWQSRNRGDRMMNLGDLVPYTRAFRDAGIKVWILGYPHAGWQDSQVQQLFRRGYAAGCEGIITDPEVSYKRQPAHAFSLVEALDRTGCTYGITSYGDPRVHRTFPYAALGGHGFGSPQIYSPHVSVVPDIIRQWRGFGWDHIVPSIPTFGANSGRHIEEYGAAMLDAGSVGVIAWSWRSTSAVEWRELERLAARF